MKKIGLTGVMGAGKSSVIAILKEEGVTVLDCDRINDELLEQGREGYTALVAEFSENILDDAGVIDRRKMSDLVFCNPINKKKAEAILHPLIQAEIMRQMQEHKEEDLVVAEVPLLFEVHWESFFDEVWVIACEEELLLQRLQQQRHVSLTEAKRRLAAQLPQEQKIQMADVVIYNNSDKNALKKQMYAILNIEK